MANQRDFAWDYAREELGMPRGYLYCKFCDKLCTGGVNRLKHHLAKTHRGMAPCTKCPEDVKNRCKKALDNFEVGKKNGELKCSIGRVGIQGGSSRGSSIGDVPHQYICAGAGVNVIGSGPSCYTPPQVVEFVNQNVESRPRESTSNTHCKDLIKDVYKAIGRFFYANGLSFSLATSLSFKAMCENIANFGPGLTLPSIHEIKTWILKEEVADMKKMTEDHKKSWVKYGCTIMVDGWTNEKGGTIINFLINSPAGTMFHKSVDASASIEDGNLIFKYLDEIVEEIGEDNVVQVVTKNHSSYVSAGKMLMERRKRIYWAPCAAHSIDLILESIGKMKVYSETIEKARRITQFIYQHAWVLSLMRSFTCNHELLCPAVNCFATTFLTLQSIYKQKQPLQDMFISTKWNNSIWSKDAEGVKARAIVLYDPKFWSDLSFCVKTTLPIVSMLRYLDSEERSSLPYLYEMVDVAKEKIANACSRMKWKYMPIWKAIDERWVPQLHHPLHATGYFLNPQLRYEQNFLDNLELRDGLYACMSKMISDKEEHVTADVQLDAYSNARGEFGSEMAIKTRKLRSPANWWARFGTKTPELTKFAIRVLSLTCSATGYERNWSTFEQVHTRKRNRLEHQRLNACVFVMHNMKLRERSMRRKLNPNVDPILIEQIDSDDEWITMKEDPILPSEGSWLEDDSLALDVTAVETIGDLNLTESMTINGGAISRKRTCEDGNGAFQSKTRPQRIQGNFKNVQAKLVDEEFKILAQGGNGDDDENAFELIDNDLV